MIAQYPCAGPSLIPWTGGVATVTGIILQPSDPPPAEATVTGVIVSQADNGVATVTGIMQAIHTFAIHILNTDERQTEQGNTVTHEDIDVT